MPDRQAMPLEVHRQVVLPEPSLLLRRLQPVQCFTGGPLFLQSLYFWMSGYWLFPNIGINTIDSTASPLSLDSDDFLWQIG